MRLFSLNRRFHFFVVFLKKNFRITSCLKINQYLIFYVKSCVYLFNFTYSKTCSCKKINRSNTQMNKRMHIFLYENMKKYRNYTKITTDALQSKNKRNHLNGHLKKHNVDHRKKVYEPTVLFSLPMLLPFWKRYNVFQT